MTTVESTLDPQDAVYREAVPAGEPWIHEIAKGQYFRIVDLHGNQSADTLFFNAHDHADRYSAQSQGPDWSADSRGAVPRSQGPHAAAPGGAVELHQSGDALRPPSRL